jgi:Arc/MetJ-type ribon-helix-helix transcriptional regulator
MAPSNKKQGSEKLTPISFKVPILMDDKINELIQRGHFKNKAELIRHALDAFLESEEKLDR